LSSQIHESTIFIFEGPHLNSKQVLSWDFYLEQTNFALPILMWSSQYSHQKRSALSIHWRSFSVSAMRAMPSANLRRAKINSPHFIPKPSFFIFSIKALTKRLKKLQGENRQPCLTPEVTGIGLEMVSLIQTKYSVLPYIYIYGF